LNAGGTWYVGETCPDFECPVPPCSADDVVYLNAGPYDDYGSPSSQYAFDYPFGSGAADDVTLEETCTITSVETWTTHWNGAEGQGPNLYEGINITIYANYFDPDAGYDMPGGYLGDDGVRVEYVSGGVIQTEMVTMDLVSFAADHGCTDDRWHISDIPITPIDLEGGVKYWLEIQPVMPFTGGGQSAVQVGDANTGDAAEQIFILLGMDPWTPIDGNGGSCPDTDPAGTYRDLAFCLHGTCDVQPPDCVYIVADCDHNGVPLELTDVVAMIGYYRGLVVPAYECDCEGISETFTPDADPNGNCVAYELSDVVAEISYYRGQSVPGSGCQNCPGQGGLAPGDGGTLVIPSLKSKVKASQSGSAD
ncbi:MAG: hypothetical protein V3S06_06445, partial [candidate division Zixibacteria bacterium]